MQPNESHALGATDPAWLAIRLATRIASMTGEPCRACVDGDRGRAILASLPVPDGMKTIAVIDPPARPPLLARSRAQPVWAFVPIGQGDRAVRLANDLADRYGRPFRVSQLGNGWDVSPADRHPLPGAKHLLIARPRTPTSKGTPCLSPTSSPP